MTDANLETTDTTATAHYEAFEDQLERLQTIVKALDDPRVPLAEMLSLYSEGITLAQTCRTILENASQQINEISHISNTDALGEAFNTAGSSPMAADDIPF